MTLFNRKQRSSPLSYSFPAPISQCWGIWHWLLTTWLGSTLLWGRGVIFSPKSDEVCQQFFPWLSERNPKFFIWNWFFDHNFKTKWSIFITFGTHICKNIIFVFLELSVIKQWHLGSGHSIIKQSIRKNVLFQIHFQIIWNQNFWCVTKFR